MYQIPRRVSGRDGEFDTSARAMYRNEVVFPLQAELRIVRGSTIERKQMSTKTTFKRIALVTVAALGFGVMSVVPSNAVSQADSLTLSAATAAQTTAETMTASSAVATLSFIAQNAGDTLSVTASLVSAPSGNTALPVLAFSDSVTTTVVRDAAVGGNSRAFPYDMGLQAFVNNSAASATLTTAKFKVYIAGASAAAPTKVGTYVVKLTPAVAGGGGTLNGTAQTLTITVTADANLDTIASAANSTSYIAIGEAAAPVVAAVDDVVAAAKTLTTSTTEAAATIYFTQLNAAAKGLATTPASAGESLTVTITGPGSIAQAAAVNMTRTGERALTLKNGNVLGVFADGSAGVGKISIARADGSILATEEITFFSTVTAKLTASVKKAYILAGGTGNADGGLASSASVTNTRVFLVNATDADGRDMADGAGAITVKPTTATTDALIGAAGVCTYKAKTSLTAAGYYCSAPGVSSTKFGKVNYTFTATNADLTTVTTTADVTFSDSVATKITVTGPASAAVGELIKLTYTATEKNGFPVADTVYEGAAAAAATPARGIWDSVVYSSSAFQPFNVGETITTVSGVATKELYVPVTAGSVTGTWTLAGDGTAISGGVAKAITATDVVYTVAVTNPGVDAAAAAAEEATAAANDATDAALSAAEAAEAATAMAQEAVDAVAELSASVTKLISALRAQITTLTNLVVKIQKKVKA